MLSVEEALSLVGRAALEAAAARSLRREPVALRDALGRTLAEDVAMDHDVPPFDRATMDGFAVRAADVARVPVTLAVVGRVPAGTSSSRPVGAGEAVAIMTGAPMPAGADAVVPVEGTDPAAGSAGAETAVRVRVAAAPRANVAFRGEQVRDGAVVLRAGTRLHPGSVGVLAVAGRATVLVAARPRVAILATGDELVPAERRPGPSQIRDSNGHALAAQAERAGATAAYGGPVPDDPAALAAAVERGLEAEVLCLSGGVSLGERDFVPGVLAARGVERLFHRWAVKPGGPLWFGRRGATLVFALPGNPAASFVGFEVLAVPALRALLGRPFGPRSPRRAVFDGTAGKAIPRRRYVPVELLADGARRRARPVPWTGSGDAFGLAAADALAVIPEGAEIAVAGEREVDVIALEVGS